MQAKFPTLPLNVPETPVEAKTEPVKAKAPKAKEKPTEGDLYGLKPIEGKVLYRMLHVTDFHKCPLGRVPSSRSETYHMDCASENLALAQAVKNLKANIIVHSGDLFHLKAQSVYQPDSLNYHAREIQNLGVPFLSIAGNHDMPSSAVEELPRSAYTNVMAQAQNAYNLGHKIVEDRVEVDYEPYSVTVSTHDGKELPIHIYGLPYLKKDRLIEEMEKLNQKIGTDFGLNVVMLHGDFFPDDYKHGFVDPIRYSQMSAIMSNASVFCLGHIHQMYPVTQLTNGARQQYVSKPWSLGRVVKDYHNNTEVLEHQHVPSFSCITIYEDANNQLQIDVQYGTLPHKGFKDSFNLESVKEEIKDSQKIHEYIEQLRNSSAQSSLTPEDYLTQAGQTIDEEVKQLILFHLEKASY